MDTLIKWTRRIVAVALIAAVAFGFMATFYVMYVLFSLVHYVLLECDDLGRVLPLLYITLPHGQTKDYHIVNVWRQFSYIYCNL